MSKLVKETQDKLNEIIIAAVKCATAKGELPESDMPSFII